MPWVLDMSGLFTPRSSRISDVSETFGFSTLGVIQVSDVSESFTPRRPRVSDMSGTFWALRIPVFRSRPKHFWVPRLLPVPREILGNDRANLEHGVA